jgi:hypothetical protein
MTKFKVQFFLLLAPNPNKINPTTEVMAKDVIQSNQASGSSHGPKVDLAKESFPGSLYCVKQRDDIVQLANMQEDSSNKLLCHDCFIERTSVMKKVCIPCSPRALLRILHENPSWCS